MKNRSPTNYQIKNIYEHKNFSARAQILEKYIITQLWLTKQNKDKWGNIQHNVLKDESYYIMNFKAGWERCKILLY